MADEIIVKYVADVKQLQKSLDGISKRLDSVEKGAKKSAKNTESAFNKASSSITDNLKNIAGAVGIAFGTQQLIAFSKEAVQLAGKMEGVKAAFDRLNRPNLLANLRKATRGTVTDLVLMQQAVRAQNFQVPLEKLASFFEFATKRSIETGESVDYLVNSIIDGIGRKSTLVLDNLGISATQLQAEMKRTGDFGEAAANIISQSLAETGEVIDTTTIRMAQLNVELENAKTSFGEALITLGLGLAESLNIIEDVNETLSGTEEALKTISQWDLEDLRNGTKSLNDIYLDIVESLEKVNALKREENELGTSSVDRKRRTELITLIAQEELRLNALRDVFETYKAELERVDVVEKETIKNLAFYNNLIKELKTEQVKANKTRAEVAELEVKINQAIEDRLHLLGRLTPEEEKAAKAFAKLMELDADDPFELFGEGITDVVERATTKASDDWEAHFDYLMSLQDEAFENERNLIDQSEQNRRDVFDTTIAAWQEVTQTAAMLTEAQYDRQFAALDRALKKEEITREEYDRRKAQLGKEQAKKQKEFAITMAIINTALGVTNAFATAPNIILGAVLAAVVAAAGAAEIATIASQPLPQFAEGGFVDSAGMIHGRSHSQGGVMIEAEGNEFITQGKYAKTNANLLQAINSGQADKYITENHIAPAIESILNGGMGAIGASARLNGLFNDKNMLKAFDRNRQSERDSARFIVEGITKGLERKSKDRYV